MISAAIEICWRSTPRAAQKMNVIPSVIGIDSAIRTALRHSMNNSEIKTTMTMASTRLSMNRSILLRTRSGSSLVRSIRRSSGRTSLSEARPSSSSRPKSAICVPLTWRIASVIALDVHNRVAPA